MNVTTTHYQYIDLILNPQRSKSLELIIDLSSTNLDLIFINKLVFSKYLYLITKRLNYIIKYFLLLSNNSNPSEILKYLFKFEKYLSRSISIKRE